MAIYMKYDRVSSGSGSQGYFEIYSGLTIPMVLMGARRRRTKN
jgi:hypothetical protein